MGKKSRSYLFIVAILSLGSLPCFAHSGRTDSRGGHHVTATGSYHFHHGHPPHDHIDGVCPYAMSTLSRTSSGSTTSKGDLLLYSIIGIGIVAGGSYWCYKTIKHRRERKYFQSMYAGREVHEIAKAPESLEFDRNNLPLISDGSEHIWGAEYTVYLSRTGSCYHKKKGCSNSNEPIHVFRAIRKYHKCSRCVHHQVSIPTWYEEYLKVMAIKKKYML